MFDDGLFAVLPFLHQLGVGRLLAFAFLQELFGAGTGDGAEIVYHLLLAHAYAGIGDGEHMVLPVGADAYLKGQFRVAHGGAGSLQEAHLLQCVGGVGKQFPQEDLVIGIERMGKDIEQFARFRAKLMRSFRHGAVS